MGRFGWVGAVVALAVLIFSTSTDESFGQSRSRIDRFTHFVNRVVPDKYPKMISYAQGRGRIKVPYTTASGESNSVIFENYEGRRIIIETSILGLISRGQSINTPTTVFMIDKNLDGEIDEIIYQGLFVPGGAKVYKSPKDEASLMYWYVSLDTIFRYSGCCR